MRGLTVKIDLYGNGELEDIWEGVIFGLNKNEIIELSTKYDEEYSNDQFDGAWEEYLDEKNIRYEHFSFDVDI